MSSSKYIPLYTIATINMGTSPASEFYNSKGDGLPLLNGPTEFGESHPNCTVFTTQSKKECQPGDLIFCVRGSTTGRMNWADKIYSLGRGVCSIRGETPLDTKFIKYCLDYSLESLLNLAGGGTFPNLTKDTIFNFEIPYPESRRKIAAVLSAYDELIENNNRRIAILEEMAQNLYQEWFVRFKYPGYEGVPVVESELGLIPAGWEVVNLETIYTTSSGGTPDRTKPEYYGGNIAWVKTRELKDAYINSTEEYLTELGLNNSSAKVFPENSVIMAMYGATIGQLGILGIPASTNQACCVFLSKIEVFEHTFLFSYLKANREYILSFRMGAAQQNISQQIIRKIKIITPPHNLIASFTNISSTVFAQIKNLQQKNTILRQSRDLLLPRLISGELDLSDLEIVGSN